MKYYTNGKILWRMADDEGQLEGFHGQTQKWIPVGKKKEYTRAKLLHNELREISYEDVMLELL